MRFSQHGGGRAGWHAAHPYEHEIPGVVVMCEECPEHFAAPLDQRRPTLRYRLCRFRVEGFSQWTF